MSTQAPLPPLRSQENPPFYRDANVLRWTGQIVVLAVIVGFFAYIFNNAVTNLENTGLPAPGFEAGRITGFDFLQGKFGSAIPGIDDSADFSVSRAFAAGYLNTIRVIMFGIPGCTIIGIIIGVMRLSKNLAARTVGTIYVETFRNIPALVWIFIFHFAIAIAALPAITGADNEVGTADDPTFAGAFVLSNRGIGIPWLNPEASTVVFAAFVLLAFVAAYLMGKYRGRVNARTGEPARGGLWGTAAFLAVLVIGHFVAGSALNLDPAMIEGRQVGGGLTVQIPYFSVTIALTLYTASHVAEIVRGAILAIHKGQTEAANAIALTNFQRYRFIILPQAFRIMIPPLANQYLNITKNSSLAIAVGYIEIAAIFGRIVNNAAPAVQGVLILMVLYLTFSLTISLIANIINRRLALSTR